MNDIIDYYDSEQLIAEVEKRRTLYDKNTKSYNDKVVREKLWREVCEAIIPNWVELSEEGKERTGTDVQRKWKNIRDCFRKDVNQQRIFKEGHGKRKKRKYIFYDQLLFLLPTIQDRERKCESAQSSGEEGEENNEDANTATEQSEKTLNWRRKGRKHPVYTYEESYMPLVQDSEPEPEEIDEDKYFLLSLLPSFKKLSLRQKFTAKIEFLQTLRNLTYPTTTSSHVLSEQPRDSFEPPATSDNCNIQNLKLETDDF